jgi:hypothetical protein
MQDIDFLIAAMLFSLLYVLEEKIIRIGERRYEKKYVENIYDRVLATIV